MTFGDRIPAWIDEAQRMPETVLTTPEKLAADFARAWDEGYQACVADDFPGARAVNPYRQGES